MRRAAIYDNILILQNRENDLNIFGGVIFFELIRMMKLKITSCIISECKKSSGYEGAIILVTSVRDIQKDTEECMKVIEEIMFELKVERIDDARVGISK